jgi:hypothetical protein
MFPKIKITSLTNGEYVGFITDVVELFNRNHQDALNSFFTPLSDVLSGLDKAYKVEQGNLLTKEIIRIDYRRDEAIRGIKNTSSGYLHHFDEAVRSAGDLLIQSMNKYSKRIDRLNYQEETVAVASLLNDWENDTTLKDALTKLHFQTWKDELAGANMEFKKVYLDRVEDESAKTIVPVYKQREGVTALYKNLERKLIAYCEIDEAKYSPLKNALAELIDKYNALEK